MTLFFYIVFTICDAVAARYYLFNLGLVSFPPAGVLVEGTSTHLISWNLELSAMRMSTPAGQGLPPLSARIIWHHCYVITQTGVFIVAVEGLDEGFPIGFDPARCNLWSVAHNHPSSLCNREVILST